MTTLNKIPTIAIITAGGALAAYGAYEAASTLTQAFNSATLSVLRPIISGVLTGLGGALGFAAGYISATKILPSSTPPAFVLTAFLTASGALLAATGAYSLSQNIIPPPPKPTQQTSRAHSANPVYLAARSCIY